jgi:hypothetical protein
MDKALQLNSINVSKWQASMIVIQGGVLATPPSFVIQTLFVVTACPAVLSFVIEHELLYT